MIPRAIWWAIPLGAPFGFIIGQAAGYWIHRVRFGGR